MIRVQVDLISLGKVTPLARMLICNDMTSQVVERGNYDVYCARKSDVSRGMQQWMNNPCRTGRVENYPRLSYNIWRLIARACVACFPEEKPKA